MFNSKNPHDNSITCTVTNCAHHSKSDCCRASGIKVGTEYALDKAETFCSTFEQRPGV